MTPGQRTLRLLLSPIAAHLEDPAVTEICCNKPGHIMVEKAGSWHADEIPALDEDQLSAIATLAAAGTGQDVGPDRPLCATKLPDGQRLQICLPPAVAPGLVALTIRRPAAFVATLDLLHDKGMFAPNDAQSAAHDTEVMAGFYEANDCKAFLRMAVQRRKNIIIAGATGSGKTTLAGALIREIPLHERLVTIEDTPEWTNLPHENRVALFYSKGDQGAARVRSEDLLEASLRMRPDRVLMQELRDGAAFTYLRGVAAGHPGSITTCHAGSAQGAFDALRLMVRQHPAGQTLDDADVRELLRQMVDVVIHCQRTETSRGTRYGISEIWWKEAEQCVT